MFVLVRMRNRFSAHASAQSRRRKNSETLQGLQRLCDIYTVIKYGMLQVRENEFSLRKLSGDTAHLRTLEGTLVAGYKIINVYKPPSSRLTPTAIPTFPHPSLYFGDFNCQHVNWGHRRGRQLFSHYRP